VKHFYAILVVVLFGFAPVFADEPPYVDTTCGGWVNDDWVPNGKCVPENPEIKHATVSGTITSVKGHLVTVQQATQEVVINDKPALDAKQSGKVAVGRIIVAYGFWQGQNFYATAIY
jgi:hypothetical protein